MFACCTAISWAQSLPDQAIEVKIHILTDKSQPDEDRQAAARFLGHLSPPPAQAVQALESVLRDKTDREQIRTASVEAMATIGEDSSEAQWIVTALANALGEKPSSHNISIRAAATRALGRVAQKDQSPQNSQITHQAVQILERILTGPKEDAIVRANSAWALGQLGNAIGSSDKGEAIQALITAIRITPPNVSQTAANSLLKIPQLAASELKGKLGDSDPSFRWNVAWIIGEIGPAAKDSVPFLTSLLRNNQEDPNVRGAAAWAIGKVGRDAKAGTPNFPDTIGALCAALSNKDEDPNVRSNAAWALGRLGPDVQKVNQPTDVVARLLGDAIHDTDKDVRRNAAWALGQIDADPKIAVPALLTQLNSRNEEDPRVRTEAAVSLGEIHPLGRQVHDAVQGLENALADGNPAVRRGTAAALGQIGADAKSAIDHLVENSRLSKKLKSPPEEEDACRAAAQAVVRIADDLEASGDTDRAEQLQNAAETIGKNGYRDDADHIATAAGKLRGLRWLNRVAGFLAWMQEHRLSVFLAGSYVTFWLVLYWCFPQWVFRINEWLKPYAGYRLPKILGGIPLSYFTLGGFFHYRPRVLDAWVAERMCAARRKFETKATVAQREVHVEVPVLLDGKAVSALRPDHLQPYLERKRSCAVIVGEGGSGKTSLACQICKWVMDSSEVGRMSSGPMLAVLLEQENLENRNGKDLLVEAVRTELRHLTDSADAPSTELVQKLLETKRILVVIDGLSEMPEGKRSRIQPSDSNFPAHAVLITSRVELTLPGIDMTVIKPMRVQGDRLSTFMDAYLVQRNAKDKFSDTEYFDYLGKLSRIVGEREVTVLLAKMYAEQMIAAKQGDSGSKLPENIPDLVLEYLNELNRRVRRNRLDDRVVHRDAKVVAWECLNRTYRPMSASMERILAQMEPQSSSLPEERLKYLEDRLRLVQTTGAGRDRVRFSLDPLAEYLAALWCVESFQGDEEAWRRFLVAGDGCSGTPEMIRGFLLAVRDCCVAKGSEIGLPNFLLGELSKRTGLDRPDRKVAGAAECQAENEPSMMTS